MGLYFPIGDVDRGSKLDFGMRGKETGDAYLGFVGFTSCVTLEFRVVHHRAYGGLSMEEDKILVPGRHIEL